MVRNSPPVELPTVRVYDTPTNKVSGEPRATIYSIGNRIAGTREDTYFLGHPESLSNEQVQERYQGAMRKAAENILEKNPDSEIWFSGILSDAVEILLDEYGFERVRIKGVSYDGPAMTITRGLHDYDEVLFGLFGEDIYRRLMEYNEELGDRKFQERLAEARSGSQ